MQKDKLMAIKSYDEIIDFIAAGSSPEAVVAFHPSTSVQQRVEDLIERSKAQRARMRAVKEDMNTLDLAAASSKPSPSCAFSLEDDAITAEEQSELEDYLQLEHIMMMRRRARQHTQLG